MAAIRIGTSGWSYRDWVGPFYPKGLKQGDWLTHYAGHFDTVEVNASFYRLPQPNMIEGWKRKVPEGFLFAVKGWRAITHYRRLAGCEDLIARFYERAELFGDTLGPVLFQLPPDLEADPGRLERFLEALPQGRRHAFEFRHASWHGDDTLAVLERHNAAFAAFDLAGFESPRPATANFVYARLHGYEKRYQGAYDDAILDGWAEWLTQHRAAGRDAFLYFDNTDVEGAAIADAQRLKQRLEAG